MNKVTLTTGSAKSDKCVARINNKDIVSKMYKIANRIFGTGNWYPVIKEGYAIVSTTSGNILHLQK